MAWSNPGYGRFSNDTHGTERTKRTVKIRADHLRTSILRIICMGIRLSNPLLSLPTKMALRRPGVWKGIPWRRSRI